MTTDIYRALQERLDLFSIGFPPAPSGVEITILKRLFSEEDADLFLKLTGARPTRWPWMMTGWRP